MTDEELKAQEEKTRVEACAAEIQQAFAKYKCHPLMKVSFSSGGAPEFRFDVETDVEPHK